MKNLSNLLFFLFLSIPFLSLGQNYLPQAQEKPFIEVTGRIEKEIIPDEIYISIKIEERMEGKTKISIEKQETDLKNAIKSLGIDMKNLSLKGAIASYQKVKWTKKDVMADSEYLLKVTDAKTLGLVFDKLASIKISNARVSKVDHSRLQEYKKETRINAIKAAKEKADYLLGAIGEETGMPLIIRESPYYENARSTLNSRANLVSNEYYVDPSVFNAANELQFEKLIVSSSIYVKFQIKEQN